MESTPDSTRNSQGRQPANRVAFVETTMRCLASAALLWSLGGLAYLYWIVSDQPQRFFPLVIRESDTESDRIAAIDAWRVSNIPSNTEPLLGNREPVRLYQLDPQLSFLPGTQSGAADRSFQQRLFELNVGVEEFCRDYWSNVWKIFEFGTAALLASALCIAFPRILSSSLLLLIVSYPGVYHLSAWWRSEVERQSLLWSVPLLGSAMACLALAIYRWRIAPAPAEITNNWNKLWLGLLLTGIGLGAFYVLIAWGGRTRSNGLAGIGLSFGWGVYLVAKHGWKLIKTLLGRSISENS